MARTLDPKKYRDILAFLQAHFSRNFGAPTYTEIVTGARLSSKCLVAPYLERLRADGLVQYTSGKPRTLRLTEAGRGEPRRPETPRQRVAAYISMAARINAAAAERMVRLPVVGRTFAGQTTPIPNTDFASYDDYTEIEVSEDALPNRARRDYYFVLEVSGDSMIEANIYDGDYVICRKSETAENHEMVVALLTDTNETTLKYFVRESDHIRLQPANSAMQPILIHDASHLIIQGVVVQVVHCRY